MNKKQQPDPSQNLLAHPPHFLDTAFTPRTIAVIGATEKPNSVGRTIMANLLNGIYKGKIYPVNPKREKILDQKCYPDLKSIPDDIDLAIVVTPARTVPDIISSCVEKKIPMGIVISAGFKELGDPGLKLEKELLRRAKEGNMRIIGPNCLGIMNPIIGLNATFAAGTASPGNIAFISQSGAMCTAVLDWSFRENVGYSSFVSIGSMADVHWGDLIDYLGNDPNTSSILIYMETIGDARAFLSAAREVTLTKPIIVIKAGRTEAAAKAAASHTGSLAGSDDVFDAAMKRAGVLRVNTISELFDLALVLAKQPKPEGPRLTIMTNAGGPGVLATDEAIFHGAEMAVLRPETIAELSTFLPEAWSHDNPVDLLGDAGPERYAKALEVVAKDPDTDGILVILSPQDVTDPTATANALKDYAHLFTKPIFASWMGGKTVEKGLHMLNNAGIPAFEYPDSASKMFANMWRYSDNLKSIYETPIDLYEIAFPDKAQSKQEKVRSILETAQNEKRELLTEMESKQILDAYDIPTVQTIIATSSSDAVKTAEKIGFPVVLKIHSETLTHKTDVGGVKLNINSPEEVAKAYTEIEESVTKLAGKEHFQGVTVQKMIKMEGYEIIIGSTSDPQFGPVILFGSGGSLVEVYKDQALGLPPLNATLAQRLMQQTKVFTALQGVRGKGAVDIEKLERIMIAFSYLITEHPEIKELDINPLLVSENQIIALDARVVIHTPDEELPALAIRPYPIKYMSQKTLKNKTEVTLRPIRPEDEPLIIDFHERLCQETVRQRYLEFLSLDERIAHLRLIRICCVDYDRNIPLVAKTKDKKIIGVIRLIKNPATNSAEFKVVIEDAFQNQGLGSQFLDEIIEVAKGENIRTLHAQILDENKAMLHLCEKKGFQLTPSKENSALIDAFLSLQ